MCRLLSCLTSSGCIEQGSDLWFEPKECNVREVTHGVQSEYSMSIVFKTNDWFINALTITLVVLEFL